jgi:hypothetical protein
VCKLFEKFILTLLDIIKSFEKTYAKASIKNFKMKALKAP